MGIIYKNGIKYGGGDSYIVEDKSLIPVVGTQTSSTGSWTGNIDIPHLYNGLTIAYFLPYAPSGNATLNLTLSDGTTTGPINCYYNTNRLTTHYAKGSNIIMTFWGAGSISVDGTAITDDRWVAQADYDSNSNTWRNIQVNGTQKLGTATNTGALNFKDGENTSISYDNGVKIDAIDTTYDFSAGNSIGYFKVEDSNGEEKEITPYYEVDTDQTGVLPLTFTAKGGTAADWTIYGNDDVGENLFDKTTSVDGSYVTTTGTQPASDAAHSDYIPVEASQSYYLTDVVGISVFYSAVEYDNNKSAIGYLNISGSSKVSGAITTSSNAAYVCINFKPANLDTIMLVKGSTAPDHYIPYQQGVGERTENLFDGTIVQGVWNSLTGQVPTIVSSSKRLATSTMLAVDATETYNIKVFSATSDVLAVAIKLLNSAKEQISDTGWAGVSTSISGADYIVVNIQKFSGSDITPADAMGITITKGSTAPTTYIPYGYQIPLTTTSGADSKTVDIYIGDSPLTKGETVSKTSTGVDIELFEGENTVSTTLYNKPEMKINYLHQVDIDPYINSKIPTALKNPYALTINYNTTKSFDYNGSTAKSLSIKAGDNITLSGDTNGNITINGTANTWTALVGATSSANGSVGYINATPPKEGYNTKFFRADGTWAVPSYTTNTTYTLSTGDFNGQIKVTPSSGNAYNVDVKGLGSNAYSSTAYLPLTGGTVTGVINIKSSNLDRNGEVPTDDQAGKSLYFVDKDDDRVGRIYTLQRKTNNKKDLFISVYNASGTTNSIGIRILDDGTQSYYLSNPSAFRDTLDNATYIGANTITSNQVIIADGTDGKLKSSGYTINKSVPSDAVFTDEKVKTNLIAPEGDKFPIYYLTATDSTTKSAKQLYMNNNVIIRIQTGTASTLGRARLVLGNDTAEETADNCCGQLLLYSTDSGYSVLRQSTGTPSTGITIYLPPKAGTIFNTGNLAAGNNITLTESNGVYSINGTANTDTKVSQTATTTSANYEILFSATADNTTRTEGARKTSGLRYNPDSDTLIIGRSGTSSGRVMLYGSTGALSTYGILKQSYNPDGNNVTHTFPTVGGYVFNSGNVSAGAGITISASGDRYTIKSKNKIYLYKTHTSLFSDINDDSFRNCKYFKIYYKDSNNCNYNCITMNMDTNIFPEGSGTSYVNGNVFTLSCVGDVNKTYLRTATFHFATKSGGGTWKLVFNSSFLWDPSQATGSSLTWTSTKQTSYSNSYIKIIKLEYFWEDT